MNENPARADVYRCSWTPFVVRHANTSAGTVLQTLGQNSQVRWWILRARVTESLEPLMLQSETGMAT
eukprot:2753891-Alexandrium_andersonii.AAC.1